MKFKNLTPHAIRFQFSNGERTEFQSEGLARVDVLPGEGTVIEFEGQQMPVNPPVQWGPVSGLPEPEEGTIFIVSLLVIGRPEAVGRKDVVAPATGPKDGAIRFEEGPNKGQIDAVTRWVAA